MYCKNCGTKLKEEENFCPNCGYQTTKPTTNNPKKENIPLILGIIACIFFWIPIISLPLAIISIILGINYKKETGKKTIGTILGIISIILSIIEIVLVVLFCLFLVNKVEESIDVEDAIEHFYDSIYEEENIDIRGYSWQADDNSVLYLNQDKTYTWYQSDTEKTDNFYSGTYEFYTGNNAIIYIADNLKEYHITEEEQRNLIRREGYDLNDYYLIILNCDKMVKDSQEQIPNTRTIYYYGFYQENQKYLDLKNIANSTQVRFTLKEKITNIDL